MHEGLSILDASSTVFQYGCSCTLCKNDGIFHVHGIIWYHPSFSVFQPKGSAVLILNLEHVAVCRAMLLGMVSTHM